MKKISHVFVLVLVFCLAGCLSLGEERIQFVGLTSDANVTTDVKSAISRDDQLRDAAIVVSVKNGIVSLKGQVLSERDRRRALTIAEGVQGVTDVKDKLVVQALGGEFASTTPGLAAENEPVPENGAGSAVTMVFVEDETIEEQCLLAVSSFFFTAETPPVTVRVRDGLVTLYGTIKSTTDLDLLVEKIQLVEGVINVNPLVRVEPTGEEWPEPSLGD